MDDLYLSEDTSTADHSDSSEHAYWYPEEEYVSDINTLLGTNNKRRQSQRPEDKAYMQHWYSCFRSTCQGSHPCSVFGLCPEGQRLDAICHAAEAHLPTNA